MTEVVAFIPARCGSKALPGKNLASLNGLPLIIWTIRAALGVDVISKVVVSSDGDEILDLAVREGADIVRRPCELSGDQALSIEAVLHALSQLNLTSGIGLLLQPTSPLRTSVDIDKALRLFAEKNASSVISGFESPYHPMKTFVGSEFGELTPLVSKEHPFLPRQLLPKAFCANGAIYVFNIRELIQKRSFYIEPCFIYEMSEDLSLDIDTEEDLKKVSLIMSDLYE